MSQMINEKKLKVIQKLLGIIETDISGGEIGKVVYSDVSNDVWGTDVFSISYGGCHIIISIPSYFVHPEQIEKIK